MSDRFDQTVVESVVEHMNTDHAEALLLYVRHFANMKSAQHAVLTDLDRQGMSIEVRSPGITLERIDFTQPLVNENDIRPMLVAMAREARESID